MSVTTGPWIGSARRKQILNRLNKVRRAIAVGWRQPLIDHAPAWSRRLFGPVARRLDMLLVDHGIFRLFYLNRHRLGDKAWRSAQPAPHDIRAMARRGVRTVINLRGERQCGAYWLEQSTCQALGITMVDFQLRSRAAPTREEIHAARALFERVEYPIWMHCKSGADRAGVMGVLYRIHNGEPVEKAKRELSWRYGHFRTADTGILDHVFDRYIEDNGRQPRSFFDWVDTVYDPVALKREFRAKGWANRLVDGVLRRE